MNTLKNDHGVEFEPSTGIPQPASSINLSTIQKDFLLSRIVVSPDDSTSDTVYSESDIAKIKNDLGAVEIPKDEAEKFGLEDHPLHIEHMNQPA